MNESGSIVVGGQREVPHIKRGRGDGTVDLVVIEKIVASQVPLSKPKLAKSSWPSLPKERLSGLKEKP